MSRVEITGSGCSVTVEHDGDLPDVERTARTLWDHARGVRVHEMSAGGMGFGAEQPGHGPAYVSSLDVDLSRPAPREG